MNPKDAAFLANLDALLAHVRGEIQMTQAEVDDLDVTVRTLAQIGTEDDSH